VSNNDRIGSHVQQEDTNANVAKKMITKREILTDWVLLCSICLISSKTWRKDIYNMPVKELTERRPDRLNKNMKPSQTVTKDTKVTISV